MSFHDSVSNPSETHPPTAPAPPSGPPGPPQVDMMASEEMQAWIARLEAEQDLLGTRNKYLSVALAGGVLLLLIALWVIRNWTVGAYAVLDEVAITRDPANQGRLDVSFRVAKPGKVHYRRTSGRVQTDLIDYFKSSGEVSRSWSWVYEPGSPIDVTLWHRGSLLCKVQHKRFTTADRAEIVILIDTTGSMTRFIAELKEKCATFSEQLRKQSLAHRFALIGYGDTREVEWLDSHGFTADVTQFRKSVSGLQRFDGGDFPESALDALEEALSLPFDEKAIRRFYLVTDAAYHEPARSGATAAQIAKQMESKRVLLQAFSRPQYENQYGKLLGKSGRFQEIENFGKLLDEGRVLED